MPSRPQTSLNQRFPEYIRRKFDEAKQINTENILAYEELYEQAVAAYMDEKSDQDTSKAKAFVNQTLGTEYSDYRHQNILFPLMLIINLDWNKDFTKLSDAEKCQTERRAVEIRTAIDQSNQGMGLVEQINYHLELWKNHDSVKPYLQKDDNNPFKKIEALVNDFARNFAIYQKMQSHSRESIKFPM